MITRLRNGKTPVLYSFILGTIFLSIINLKSEAMGATYYLSTSGSDSATGTSSLPWKTFSFAIPKLLPGDTLVLADGMYHESTSGFPDIRCGTNAKSGAANQPISLKAENERMAFLRGDGLQFVLHVRDCGYWNFYGLRIESTDMKDSPSQAHPVYVYNSHHLTFQRLLLNQNNRYQNSALLTLHNTHNSLIEDSELYAYHRHGITISNGNGNIVRRNYINSRFRTDISGGYPSDPSDQGDGGITIYPGSNNIVENNIIENTGAAVDIEAYNESLNNRFLGNISLNNNYGGIFHARGNSLSKMPQDTFMENHVALKSRYYGTYFRGAKNTVCKNCTSLDSGYGGFAADKPSLSGDGNPTFYSKNSLALNNSSYGFLMQSQGDFGIENSNAIGQSLNFSPTVSPTYNKISSVNSGLGSCKVFIPENSPMKGAGTNGEDIGANVLYRYENGELTGTPLWDPDSGEFPCGKKVAGVNDISGASCFDVHKRLNVNTNNCSFPGTYGLKKTSAPQNVRVQSVK